MLGTIPYTPKQETIKQICRTERAWMELLPQMGNFNWDPFDVTTLLLRDNRCSKSSSSSRQCRHTASTVPLLKLSGDSFEECMCQ